MGDWECRSVVEYTPRVYEALNSVPSDAKKNKK